jgi:hypothetical protein
MRKTILKVALPIALLAIVATGILTGVALAQGGGSGDSQSSTKMDQFLGFLANRLGISTDQLKDDVKGASTDTVDQMEKDGTITSQQADQLRQQIQNGDFPGMFGRGGCSGKGGMGLGTSMNDIVQAVAGDLNLTPQEILDQFKSGKNLAEIADAQGVSRDDLKGDITTAVGQQLDKAVGDGKITQDRADQLKTKLADNLDKVIDWKRGSADTQESNTSPMWRGGTQRGASGMGMPFM